MKRSLIYRSSLSVLAGALLTASAFASEPAQIRMIRHSDWSSIVPKGVEADGIRRNLAVKDSVKFKELSVSVVKMTAAEVEVAGEAANKSVDRVTISLSSGDMEDTVTLDEGDAISWGDYHIAIVAVYAKKGDLGFGSTVFEISTTESLPSEVVNSTKAGGAESRLRVPHTIDKLTLHHSATPLKPEDDLGQKLENMQKWGENDRNWWDVPYHYIIDLDGTVFQGRDHRFVGDTNTRYDPSGHFLINCYGNYNEQYPNDEQLHAVASLMAWAAEEFEIDPLELYGHCDLAKTSCPGANLHQYITDGTLESMVEGILETGKPEIVWVEPGK